MVLDGVAKRADKFNVSTNHYTSQDKALVVPTQHIEHEVCGLVMAWKGTMTSIILVNNHLASSCFSSACYLTHRCVTDDDRQSLTCSWAFGKLPLSDSAQFVVNSTLT
jgi:hypothetical protein